MNAAIATVPLVGDEINLSDKDIARFWSKVDKINSPLPDQSNPHYAGLERCWVWTACKTGAGYGQLCINGKMILTHRIAWTLEYGRIPVDESYNGTLVCHRCDNPKCCRADHLFLGTTKDNMRDKVAKGRSNPASGDRNGARTQPWSRARGETHGTRTRPDRIARGEARGLAKLTDAEVVIARDMYAAGGYSHRSLAAHFNVSHVTIGCAIRGDTWSHVPKEDWI